MASASGQEEFLAVIRKSQEAVIAAVRNLAETVRTASPKLASVYAPLTDNLPKPPSVSMPFADKLPGPEDAVASAYDFAGQLLASQRKFAEDLLRAKPEGAVAGTYDFAEQLLASQRKFAEDLLKAAAPLAPGRAESAPATETYKPGQVVPRDGTVECARHHDVQNHVVPRAFDGPVARNDLAWLVSLGRRRALGAARRQRRRRLQQVLGELPLAGKQLLGEVVGAGYGALWPRQLVRERHADGRRLGKIVRERRINGRQL